MSEMFLLKMDLGYLSVRLIYFTVYFQINEIRHRRRSQFSVRGHVHASHGPGKHFTRLNIRKILAFQRAGERD